MYQTLLTSIENNVLTVTINRPDKLNALNKDVFTDLDKALNDIEKNPEIRSAIITGAGPKAFVAGADISEFSNYSKEQAMEMAEKRPGYFF
jgi:enoyl-CoA hydratase